jgi:hypothetical protein
LCCSATSAEAGVAAARAPRGPAFCPGTVVAEGDGVGVGVVSWARAVAAKAKSASKTPIWRHAGLTMVMGSFLF